jgi:hypothetical protein
LILNIFNKTRSKVCDLFLFSPPIPQKYPYEPPSLKIRSETMSRFEKEKRNKLRI